MIQNHRRLTIVASGVTPVSRMNKLVHCIVVHHDQDRLDFANSFQTIWHFQNIYVSGTSYFPILGATFKPGPLKMWSIYQRRDLANDEGEVYIPTLAGEGKPQGDQILESFQN